LLPGLLFASGLTSAAWADEAYRIGSDDVLTVTVLRHPELSADPVVVSPDGSIQAPMIGAIKVIGKTLPEISQAIANALRSRLVNPEVNVALKALRIDRIFVLGPVAKPGIYDLKPGWRVTEALAAAGGLIGRPEMVSASLFRSSGDTTPVALPALLLDGNSPANLQLKAGDVLSLTQLTLRVSVAGQVQKPGLYDIPTGAGAVEAVAIAGGALPGAALSKVMVQRADGKALTADLFRAMVLGEVQNNLKLESGDLVMVPQSKAKIAVLGAVNKPGYYDIEEGLTPRVADAIALAGGAVKRARLNQVGVMRNEKGKSIRLMVNMERVLRGGRTDEDMQVRSGDLIYVPEAQVDWEFALRALTSISLLGGTF
jgi:polysaccharide export outer membrane protein